MRRSVWLAAGFGLGLYTADRLRRVVTRAVPEQLTDRVLPDLDRTARDSAAAVDAALEVRRAVGIEDPPPRLAGERVTGPVVRAVAWSAGVRRAGARLVADLRPGGRRRRAERARERTR